ncbi:helix-turn-helix transcriptional regulator [Persicimonas caeni]|uniref:Helix-turn-helix transcriptional regulator n=1 Tax=Persicimonas caeni TaxID=2292766 RepID=A0A4Y6Q2J9_PERCE|nr:helix-turn-helix transcriptional regulator [Persicimonas caeni]QED36033.1 helix-turn-helix transcriptional regulator [Persicimonas caeni]
MKGRKLVADNVRRLRKEKGLSQQELAERADMHRTHLVKFENYHVSPSIDVLFRLAHALGVQPAALLSKDD